MSSLVVAATVLFFFGRPRRFFSPSSDPDFTLSDSDNFFGRPRCDFGISNSSAGISNPNFNASATASAFSIFNFFITTAYTTHFFPFPARYASLLTLIRSLISPSVGFPDSLPSACFLHVLQYFSPLALFSFTHWLYSPWFIFTPSHHSTTTRPQNGNTIFGTSFFSVFPFFSFTTFAFSSFISFTSFIFPFTIFTCSATFSSSSASARSKPYFADSIFIVSVVFAWNISSRPFITFAFIITFKLIFFSFLSFGCLPLLPKKHFNFLNARHPQATFLPGGVPRSPPFSRRTHPFYGGHPRSPLFTRRTHPFTDFFIFIIFIFIYECW